MGLFWDLIQQSQISEQRSSTESLEERVRDLETRAPRSEANSIAIARDAETTLQPRHRRRRPRRLIRAWRHGFVRQWYELRSSLFDRFHDTAAVRSSLRLICHGN